MVLGHIIIKWFQVLSAEEERCVISGRKFLSAFFEGDHDEINVPNDRDERLKV